MISCNKKNSKRIVVDVNEDIHKEIKFRALERGLTIKQYVMQSVIRRIAEEKKYE